jgi:hypothetical protein
VDCLGAALLIAAVFGLLGLLVLRLERHDARRRVGSPRSGAHFPAYGPTPPGTLPLPPLLLPSQEISPDYWDAPDGCRIYLGANGDRPAEWELELFHQDWHQQRGGTR